ncbi:MAG: hypothetical protein P8016_13955 [Sedimentisphaerales bacterium]
MYKSHFFITLLLSLIFLPLSQCSAAASDANDTGKTPAKVYVPYEELKNVFETEGQGVFLPYRDFQKLWEAAQGRPAEISQAPFEYLISTARFDGKVNGEVANIRLELTLDILSKDWVSVPNQTRLKSLPCFVLLTAGTFSQSEGRADMYWSWISFVSSIRSRVWLCWSTAYHLRL